MILLLFVVDHLLLNHELSHWSLLIINLSTYYLRHSNLTWWFISCISSVSFQNWWFMVNRSYFLVLLKWQWYYTLHNMCLILWLVLFLENMISIRTPLGIPVCATWGIWNNIYFCEITPYHTVQWEAFSTPFSVAMKGVFYVKKSCHFK